MGKKCGNPGLLVGILWKISHSFVETSRDHSGNTELQPAEPEKLERKNKKGMLQDYL